MKANHIIVALAVEGALLASSAFAVWFFEPLLRILQ